MDKLAIAKAIEGTLEERGCFLVEVSLNAYNDIEIVIEKADGAVDWDDCAAIDHKVHECFNQDEEDYSLTVSSAGLDRPFKVLPQYLKALGTMVEVKFRDGKKKVAKLEAASEESITVDDEAFPMSEVFSVKPHIDFK